MNTPKAILIGFALVAAAVYFSRDVGPAQAGEDKPRYKVLGVGYAASNGINGMRKIPQMSLRQILPVNHNCAHYCKLKAVEICNILNHKGVQKKKCLDKSFDLCLSMLRYGDC